jgi:hypothetical protein
MDVSLVTSDCDLCPVLRRSLDLGHRERKRETPWPRDPSSFGLNMSTQNRLIRARRCATIALFLATGLKRFSFPNFDPAKVALTRCSS